MARGDFTLLDFGVFVYKTRERLWQQVLKNGDEPTYQVADACVDTALQVIRAFLMDAGYSVDDAWDYIRHCEKIATEQ